MDRYSIIHEKFPREIVLLKSTPCRWGRCSFCDYIADNSTDVEQIIDLNQAVLTHVTGLYGRLEVINSGSVFELPQPCLEAIKAVAMAHDIRELVFEAHWMYRHRLDEIRNFFEGIFIFFKIGVESFDDYFRNEVLHKGMVFDDIQEVADLFDSACLMVCVQGQTEAMIRKDIELALRYFKRCTVNVYNNNTTDIKRDPALLAWFVEECQYLKDEECAEVLMDIADFGVG